MNPYIIELDDRDRLSGDEYNALCERHNIRGGYDDWYIGRWCCLDSDIRNAQYRNGNVAALELYGIESRKRQIRLLREAIDV